MMYSLSEISGQVKKAARGTGMPWGYAEEAANTARWLAAYQLPGAALLADYLKQRSTNSERYQKPVRTGQNWCPYKNGLLCPILTAAYLCDSGLEVLLEPIEFQNLAYPLLLLPSISQLCQAGGISGALSWQGADLRCRENRLHCADNTELVASTADRVYWNSAIVSDTDRQAGYLGQIIDDQVWQLLDSFAQQTYVPATEVSRSGAGPAD